MTQTPKLELGQGNPLFTLGFRAVSEGIGGQGVLATGDLLVSADANTAMGYLVDAGTVWYNGAAHTLGSQHSSTLASADGSNDRWDTIAFDTSTDAVVEKTGTAGSNPTPPDIGADEFLLAYIYVPAGASDIPDSQVHNWRSMHQGATSVRYDDSSWSPTAASVQAALDELQEAAQIGAYPLASGDIASGAVTSTEISDGAVALADLNNPFGLDDLTDMDVDGTDLVDATTTLYESANGHFRNEVVQALANFTGDETFSAYPLVIGTDVAAHLAGGDLLDASGGSAVYDSAAGHVPRSQQETQHASATVSANTTTSDEEIIYADVSGGALTVTLASADAVAGNQIIVVDHTGNAGSNAITIDTESTETIEGASSITISSNFGSVVLESDGTNWTVVAETPASGGTSPGGSDHQVQYNNGGAFGGAGSFRYDDADGHTEFDVWQAWQEQTTPSGSPATGYWRIYLKSDGNLYVQDDGGTETQVGGTTDTRTDVSEDGTAVVTDTTDINATTDLNVADDGDGSVTLSHDRAATLVDAPNGHIPTALLEDTESAEIGVPVPDGETLTVYRWGCWRWSDRTAPTGLQVQLLDDSDTVQSSANTTNAENTSGVASLANSSGSLSFFVLRVNNGTGSALTTDGVSAIFAYEVA